MGEICYVFGAERVLQARDAGGRRSVKNYELMVDDMKESLRLMKICCCLAAVLMTLAAGVLHAEETSQQLRLALLPVPDVLPVYVAQEKGYFDTEGIHVEALPVGSAVERDQLMQAGRVDGMINEISGAAIFNRDSSQMKIVSYARIPLGNAPLFRVLASPGAGITSVEQLAAVPIGVSKNTVIEYVTERMLVKGGVGKGEIVTSSVPVLPERLQLLLAGQIKAATLPDPLGYSAIQAGAVEIINDLQLAELSASVVSFSTRAVEEKGETVKKFMKAWDKAAKDLNEHPDMFRQLMLKKIRVPKNVSDSFSLPQYPRGKNVSRQQWEDAIEWLMEKNLIKAPVSYEASVTDEFLTR